MALRGKNATVTVRRTVYGQTSPTVIATGLRVQIQPFSLDLAVDQAGAEQTARLVCEVTDPIQQNDILAWDGLDWQVRSLIQTDGRGAHKRGLISSWGD